MEINWEMMLSAGGGLLATLGGWEGIKYLLNRKANSRCADANAEKAEVEVDKAEVEVERSKWDLFERMLEGLQDGLIRKDEVISAKDRIIEEKDRLFNEQTNRLRNTQDELNNTLKELVEIKAKYIYADTWRCEIGVCKKRKPPKPQLYGLEYNEDTMPIEPN